MTNPDFDSDDEKLREAFAEILRQFPDLGCIAFELHGGDSIGEVRVCRCQPTAWGHSGSGRGPLHWAARDAIEVLRKRRERR
jgi:hypothetical protein